MFFLAALVIWGSLVYVGDGSRLRGGRKIPSVEVVRDGEKMPFDDEVREQIATDVRKRFMNALREVTGQWDRHVDAIRLRADGYRGLSIIKLDSMEPVAHEALINEWTKPELLAHPLKLNRGDDTVDAAQRFEVAWRDWVPTATSKGGVTLAQRIRRPSGQKVIFETRDVVVCQPIKELMKPKTGSVSSSKRSTTVKYFDTNAEAKFVRFRWNDDPHSSNFVASSRRTLSLSKWYYLGLTGAVRHVGSEGPVGKIPEDFDLGWPCAASDLVGGDQIEQICALASRPPGVKSQPSQWYEEPLNLAQLNCFGKYPVGATVYVKTVKTIDKDGAKAVGRDMERLQRCTPTGWQEMNTMNAKLTKLAAKCSAYQKSGTKLVLPTMQAEPSAEELQQMALQQEMEAQQEMEQQMAAAG